MKANQERKALTSKALTFGEFVVAVYDAWGKRRAGGIVRLAVNARLIGFGGQQLFVIS